MRLYFLSALFALSIVVKDAAADFMEDRNYTIVQGDRWISDHGEFDNRLNSPELLDRDDTDAIRWEIQSTNAGMYKLRNARTFHYLSFEGVAHDGLALDATFKEHTFRLEPAAVNTYRTLPPRVNGLAVKAVGKKLAFKHSSDTDEESLWVFSLLHFNSNEIDQVDV